MTPEQVKAKLSQIKTIDKEIQNLYLELQYIDDGLFKQSVLTHTKVQGGHRNHLEHELTGQLTLKDELTETINQRVQDRLEIVKMIDSLSDPTDRLVLRLFYVGQYDIDTITELLDRSYTSVYRMKKQAIKRLADSLGDDSVV